MNRTRGRIDPAMISVDACNRDCPSGVRRWRCDRMKHKIRKTLPALLLAVVQCCWFVRAELPVPGTGPGAQVPNFRLTDHLGVSHELYRSKEARLVALLVAGNGCPIVRHAAIEWKRLREEFGSKGVEFLLLNANAHDTRAEVIDEARDFGIDFPILLDPAQGTARALGLRRTAEVLLIDPKSWHIVYRGAVDDRVDYGQQRPKAVRRHAAEAMREFLAGTPVSVARTEVKGCGIALKHRDPVDYATQVAPLIGVHCVGCHSRGNASPFAFSGFEKVRGHSATLREVLLEDRMPPWHADPHAGAFANDRSLTADERATLLEWVAQGAPRGTGTDPLPGLQPKAAPAWPLGTPDHVVSLPEPARIPATGILPYQVFTVRSPVTNDVWLRGAVIRAGNAKVLHHCLVFIHYPESLRHLEPPQADGVAGFFAGFVPGTIPEFFPAGTGKWLPKGAELIFQMHYTTTGREETDRTELGLYLSPTPPASELVTGAATAMELSIPPRARAARAEAEFVFERDAWLHEMSPHMHLRGDRFTYTAEFPDGRREVLLHIPHYDFNWQTAYRLREPMRLPKGTRIVCTGSFDNSASNPANPDPGATVRFGEQTTDEMFIGYFTYSVAKPAGGVAGGQ